MKRYKYGLNSQVNTSTDFGQLTCVGVIPVVPGETIGGRSQIKFLSESSQKMVMNRTYADTFAFYVPYRLLWDQWPDFIAGDDTDPIPTVTLPYPTTKMCLVNVKDSISGVTQLNAFGVFAYNLIWNKFFRAQGVDEVSLGDQEIKDAPLRSTTFHQRLKDEITLQDETIDVSGPTISTGDLRQAFSQDRFKKTRAYYGDKYTDYLAALGVEASWSILDEPELVGMSQKQLKFVSTTATSELDSVDPQPGVPDTVGSVGGKWEGTNQLNIRRTFAPEHGVIMIMQAVRMELELANQKGTVEWLKTERDQFYSPEFETERKQGWFPYADATTETEMFSEKFDDYRVGHNFYDIQSGVNGTWIDSPALAPTSEAILYPDYSNLGLFLNDQYAGIQLNINAQHRISKVSPIRPAQSVHGVS